MIVYMASSLVFFIFEAKSVAERGDSFFIVAMDIALIYQVVRYIREEPEIRQLTGKFESFIQESRL